MMNNTSQEEVRYSSIKSFDVAVTLATYFWQRKGKNRLLIISRFYQLYKMSSYQIKPKILFTNNNYDKVTKLYCGHYM